jgi:ElaB/YqjD/DUF883 family membrane-anchored ribosome-binding protein
MRETSDGKEEWSEAIEKARDHFKEGWQELGRAATLAKAKGQEAWERAQERGREAWEEAKEQGRQSWENLIDRGGKAWEDTEEVIRKHPTRAVGLSLLFGVLLGALLGKDRD